MVSQVKTHSLHPDIEMRDGRWAFKTTVVPFEHLHPVVTRKVVKFSALRRYCPICKKVRTVLDRSGRGCHRLEGLKCGHLVAIDVVKKGVITKFRSDRNVAPFIRWLLTGYEKQIA